MINKDFSVGGRRSETKVIKADLVVTGGGMSGTCCAISAAREGLKVVLVQDRPVLGGNASSEVRLWILGATSHMGNNNRWARESGITGEIMVENLYRNPEGNPLILDTILLEKVRNEKNITLLLNTIVYEVIKSVPDTIEQVIAFCSQNSTCYRLQAPFFCDASGDGIVAFQAGAAFRVGAESQEEFDEGFAPTEEYGELLGHSMYFYSKDAGQPVTYIPPSFALKDISDIIKYRSFGVYDHGCRLWWIEYGGRLDTVHETEEIKWELWKVLYGVWDYIKNSGKYPEAKNLTLEWVGTIPGKRESRRFEGEYMLSQKDVVEQQAHFDAVAYGGWALDLHPADGVFSERPGCNQWHSKGIYPIPLRCLYSKNIENLWLAGRIISATHVAFGSSRVMGTCAYSAQALGTAVKYCLEHHLSPHELVRSPLLEEYRQDLLRKGQHIPGLTREGGGDLAQEAVIEASSELCLTGLPFDGPWRTLECSAAQMLPVQAGDKLHLVLAVKAVAETNLKVQLRISEKAFNYTPEVVLESLEIPLKPGENKVELKFQTVFEQQQYVFICLLKNEQAQVRTSLQRITGLLSVMNRYNNAVATSGTQSPPKGIGIDTFEFWCPQRRPDGHNLAMGLRPGLQAFISRNVINGLSRPTTGPNSWVADPADKHPSIALRWKHAQVIKKIVLGFDTDFDHPMESTLMGHPERVIPFCVRNYRLKDEYGLILYEKKGNYQTIDRIVLDHPVTTKSLTLELEHPSSQVPAALFNMECY